jgi:hypothetical protein
MPLRILMLAAVALLIAGVAAACTNDTSDLESRIDAIEAQLNGGEGDDALAEQLAALHETAQRSSMIATLDVLQGVGFHELNEEIQAGGEAPAGASGSVQTALRAVAATEWPDELAADAADFQAALQAFYDALRGEGGDLQDTAQAAHDGYHMFFDMAWDHLAAQAGLDGAESDAHGDTSTPEHDGSHE